MATRTFGVLAVSLTLSGMRLSAEERGGAASAPVAEGILWSGRNLGLTQDPQPVNSKPKPGEGSAAAKPQKRSRTARSLDCIETIGIGAGAGLGAGYATSYASLAIGGGSDDAGKIMKTTGISFAVIGGGIGLVACLR